MKTKRVTLLQLLQSFGLVVTLLCLSSGVVSAAVDPALAEKAARVHEQMEQRITSAEREAAAAALKTLRQSVYQARQEVAATKSTRSLSRASALTISGFGTPYQVPTGPFNADGTPAVPDYNTTANWANSPPLAKFVDTLPGLGATKGNNLGQYLTVAVPDITTYPGTDYYEIDLVEYSEQLHSDLPPTKLRGYVQVNPGTTIKAGTLPSQALCGGDGHPCTVADTTVTPELVHYLGPAIVAERDRPVRIKFTNRLPLKADGGDLFIPVDTSVMGAGMGPKDMAGSDCDPGKPDAMCVNYTENRATIHLHGGRTPWISDGTPHQWVTPAGEDTPYPKGVSVSNVPDMPDPGDGSMTFFYSNQQSARLMFYHDHAFGITRLNVYAGEAAAYVITDPYEQDLVNRGLIPPDQIPLVIQDKTFVDASEIRKYDPLWNWGSGPIVNPATGERAPQEGDLWLPHVYMPAQNPFHPDFSGVNPFGRWMYGPWFYPPTTDIAHPPIANPYFDPNCDSPDPDIFAQCQTPGQPPLIPATPHPSMGMEAFMDTAVVNGTVFPTLEVDARAYRFRILNAANDRMFNLSLYKADPNQVSPDTRPKSRLTEVKTVPAIVTPGWPELWPVDGREGGVPDPATMGPSFLQIASEGGFLPKPAMIAPQPIGYYIDPTAFWVGNVKDHALALGPAERADVIVDFSGLAGQTLLLYNDAPAAWPAGVANYDYFTGAPDRRDTGGYGAGGIFNDATGVWEGGHGTEVGYGPNTRTVMQIIVRSTPIDPPYTFNQAALEAEFVPANPATESLFAKAQEPIIVTQSAYKEVYPNSHFPTNQWSGVGHIADDVLKFVTLANEPVEKLMEPKGIHDEMGASFDHEYGRMGGNLAMQIPNPSTLTANLILYGFPDVPTEFIDNSTDKNVQVSATLANTLVDGTQIWKISHNGVDTHPIHFHIFDVQLINRVGWDGQIALPDPNELGWKDTVRISPLEDTIVAVRPRAPTLPFGIPESQRPLNPTIPLGSAMGLSNIDPTTGQAYATSPIALPNFNSVTTPVSNQMFNFGWEYVWHCHILSHEEMDMMRPIVLIVSTTPSLAPTLSLVNGPGAVNLSWTDPTPVNYVTGTGFGDPSSEIGFRIERCTGAACTDFSPYPLDTGGKILANHTTYSDTAVFNGISSYRVVAFNAAGDSPSNVVVVDTVTTPTAPDAPTIGSATAGNAQATVAFTPPTWNGGATITSYTVTSNNGISATGPNSPITITGLNNGTTYTFTVIATNALGTSPASADSNSVTPDAIPDAPTSVTASAGILQAIVSFTPSAGAIDYTVTSSPGGLKKTGIDSPLTVTGLTSGVTYTFTVTARNASGSSPSAPSNSISTLVVPSAPTNVTAVLDSVDPTKASVSFTAPASDGGSPIISYTVTSNPGRLIAIGAGSPLVVTGLTSGTPFTFTVTARSAIGVSPASVPSNSVTSPTVPAAPTGVTAVAGNAEVIVSFALPNDGGDPITSYTVTSSPGGITASGLASPLTVTGLTNGTAYTFTVTATNGIGISPVSAASLSVTPLAVPTPPTIVSALSGNAQATVTFTAPTDPGGSAITSYTVTSSPGGFTATGTTVSPLTVTGLTNGTSYIFTVTATNGFGTSFPSAPSSSVIPATIPNEPTTVTALGGNTQATVSFAVPTDNGGSAITSYTVTSSPGGIIATGSASPITITGLTNGTSYTFTVTATNLVGPSLASLPSNSVTPVTVPDAPTIGSVAVGNAQATVNFVPSASDGGSPIIAYTVTSTPGGISVIGTTSPLIVTGLTNGTSYTFTVTATNSAGTSPSSSVSNSVIPDVYGNLNSDGATTSADALLALQMAIGKRPVDVKADVAPLVNGIPAPDGKVIAADALVILRKAVGLW